MERIEIMKSEYSDYFENIKASNTIFLYSKEFSKELWSNYFDENSKSYFSLDDENWLIKSNEFELGEWIDYFNDDNSELVKKHLQKSIDWELDDEVLFFISSLLSIQTTWEIFLNSWVSFLECDDDCPILINKSNKQKEAIIFKPIGSFSFFKN